MSLGVIELAAVEAMARDWAVFPVNGKLPATTHGVLDASTEERLAAIWFERHPSRGVGLATGEPSGVWALDLDSDDATKLWAAMQDEHGDRIKTVVSKTRRGCHLLFKMPADGTDIRNSAGQVAEGIDVRGSGGYIVLPPSPHPDGGVYGWAKGRAPDEVEIADTPDWLAALVTEKQTDPTQRALALSGAIMEGSRNNTLTSVAGTMQRRGMSQEAILAALLTENEQRCSPPLAGDEVESIVTSVSRYEPAPRTAFNGRGWASREPWPEHPRLPGLPDANPLPLDALPAVLRNMARTSHEATQAPLDSAIGAVLGGVSVAIVGKVWVEIRADTEWIKPAHTYIGIEQPSGTGKSPLINMVQKPIATWEAKKASEESSKRRWAEEQIKLAEKCVESLRKKAVADPSLKEELEDALSELTKAEGEPHGEFQLLLSDATEEGVVRVLASNGGRAASVDPEGTILEVAAGRYGNGDARLAVLTHGWDGEPMRTNRANKARVDLPSANLALLLGLQPGILEGLLNAETMQQRGVLARFLWIAPTLRWDEMLTGRDVPALDQGAVARYGEMLSRLLDSPDKSEKSEGQPHILKMSAEAQEGVYRLEQARVDGMRPGGPLQFVPAFAGKLPDHGSRIAALLTVADHAARSEDPFHDPIPGWAMESAERLISAISTHVVKVTGNAGEDPVLSDLLYLMERAVEMEGGWVNRCVNVSGGILPLLG